MTARMLGDTRITPHRRHTRDQPDADSRAHGLHHPRTVAQRRRREAAQWRRDERS